jgi:hypothetical protein
MPLGITNGPRKPPELRHESWLRKQYANWPADKRASHIEAMRLVSKGKRGERKLMKLATKIPMPPANPKGGRQPKYPWRTMEVGQSFLIRCASPEVQRVKNSLQSCKRQATKMTGNLYDFRTVREGLRIWRIA